MNIQEVRQLSDEGILKAVEDKREDMFNLRFQIASGQLEDTNAIRYARRDLARLLTVLHERQLAAQMTKEE